MKLYLAGPMTGLPDHNYPAFHTAAAALRAPGHQVINPAELHPDMQQIGAAMPGEAAWRHCMRIDIPQLLACDAVALLPGWKSSRGARLEVHIAAALGMPLLDAGTLKPLTIGKSLIIRELLAFPQSSPSPLTPSPSVSSVPSVVQSRDGGGEAP